VLKGILPGQSRHRAAMVDRFAANTDQGCALKSR
jgi:hypothetical protein